MTETNHPPQSSVDTTPAHGVFSLDSIKLFGNSDNGFWVDYEGGGLNRFRFYVEVFGDFTDFQVTPREFRRDRIPIPQHITEAEELKGFLMNWIPLWVRDFIVMYRSDFMVVLKNRGLRWRLLRDSARVKSVSRFISSFFKPRRKTSRVVFLTLTYDRSRYSLVDAWSDLRRRFHRTVRYFKRHYGVICGLGVVECHEDMYPHLHMIILLMSPAPTFYHKRVRRFCEKKVKWDKALAKEGFIDAFAPKRPNDISNYLTKYISKVMMDLSTTNGIDDIISRPKALTPFLCRLFRTPLVLVYPKGLDKKLYRPPPKPTPAVEELPVAKAVWTIKYLKPLDGVSYGSLEYWDKVKQYLDDSLSSYFSKMIGKEPKEKPYDLIYILSSIQSPPNSEFSEWLRSLLYTLHEATKELVVLGYCLILSLS